MSERLKKDFTDGNIVRLLIEFCVPFLIANLLQALYGMVDLLVVGWYCETYVMTGVNSGSQITHLVTMAVSGLTVGSTVLVGQYYAARREKDVSETIGTLFSVLAIAGIALMAVVLLLSRRILTLMNLSGDALEAGLDYLRICMYGTVFVFGYNAVSAVQRGMGDSKRPLWFVSVACVTNIALDFWFVGPLRMGAAGAAWATIIAQAVSLILAAFYLSRAGFVFDFKFSSFRIVPAKLKQLLSIGLPGSMQSIVTNLSFTLMTSLANTLGVAAGAAIGIVGRFNSVAILPVIAMSSSVSAIAAQNIAAEKTARAKKAMTVGIWISVAFGLTVFCLSQLCAETILAIFKSDDRQVIRLGAMYLRAFCFDYLCVPFVFCMNGLIISSGHSMFSFFNSSLSSLILRMPVAYFLSRTALGIAGIGYAAPAASLCSILFGGWFILTGRWANNRTGIRRERTE